MTGPVRLDRALIRVSGPDATTFLDNLLTQNLARLSESSPQYAALLSPQGKVIADMFVWADDDGVLIECDPLRKDELVRRLTMYKLRANVTLDDLTGRFDVLFSSQPFPGAAADPRLADGALGYRAISQAPPAREPTRDGGTLYEAARIAAGAPDLARDAGPEETFALEALLEELNGVDFQKGCFVGQENVSRMKRRATTRKKFCAFTCEGQAPAFATPILAGAADIGTTRSGAAGRGLAFLRLDRAAEAHAKGETLAAAGRKIQLDPPAWLILPRAPD